MLKLYKRIEADLHYHEAWADGSRVVEHLGKVGERGNTRRHEADPGLSEEENIARVLSEPPAAGFPPVATPESLMIENVVAGMGSADDLEKRHALQARMEETLGWTDGGPCDGGSSGLGTMAARCLVVDFEIARRVVEEDHKLTRFADDARIYKEV